MGTGGRHPRPPPCGARQLKENSLRGGALGLGLRLRVVGWPEPFPHRERGSGGGGRGARKPAGLSRPGTARAPAAPRDSVTASEQKRSAGGRARALPLPWAGWAVRARCRRPDNASEGQPGTKSHTYRRARRPAGVTEEDELASRVPEFKSTPVRLQGRVQLRDPGCGNSWAPPHGRGRLRRGPNETRISSRGGQARPPVEEAEVCKAYSRIRRRKLQQLPSFNFHQNRSYWPVKKGLKRPICKITNSIGLKWGWKCWFLKKFSGY